MVRDLTHEIHLIHAWSPLHKLHSHLVHSRPRDQVQEHGNSATQYAPAVWWSCPSQAAPAQQVMHQDHSSCRRAGVHSAYLHEAKAAPAQCPHPFISGRQSLRSRGLEVGHHFGVVPYCLVEPLSALRPLALTQDAQSAAQQASLETEASFARSDQGALQLPRVANCPVILSGRHICCCCSKHQSPEARLPRYPGPLFFAHPLGRACTSHNSNAALSCRTGKCLRFGREQEGGDLQYHRPA